MGTLPSKSRDQRPQEEPAKGGGHQQVVPDDLHSLAEPAGQCGPAEVYAEMVERFPT
jgi:hypothetical protein